MNIGLVGAAQSGKSDLAAELKRTLDGKVEVIDDYVHGIGKDNDIAIGIEGNYISNLYVVLGRHSLERKSQNCGCFNHVITCGTLIDSSVYATLNAMQHSKEPEQQSQNWTRISNFMNVLGSIYQDTMAGPAIYDQLFVMNDTKSTDEGDIQIQNSLFMALNSFGYPYTALDSDDTVEQAKQIVSFINEEEYEPAQA